MNTHVATQHILKIVVLCTARAMKRCLCSGFLRHNDPGVWLVGLVKGLTVQVVSQRRVHCNAKSHARDRLEDSTLRVRAQ